MVYHVETPYNTWTDQMKLQPNGFIPFLHPLTIFSQKSLKKVCVLSSCRHKADCRFAHSSHMISSKLAGNFLWHYTSQMLPFLPIYFPRFSTQTHIANISHILPKKGYFRLSTWQTMDFSGFLRIILALTMNIAIYIYGLYTLWVMTKVFILVTSDCFQTFSAVKIATFLWDM